MTEEEKRVLGEKTVAARQRIEGLREAAVAAGRGVETKSRSRSKNDWLQAIGFNILQYQEILDLAGRGTRARLAESLKPPIAAYRALARMVKMQQAIKFGWKRGRDFRPYYKDYLDKWLVAYKGRPKPKAHYTGHLGMQVEADDNIMLDAFPLERKHLVPKAFANNVAASKAQFVGLFIQSKDS